MLCQLLLKLVRKPGKHLVVEIIRYGRIFIPPYTGNVSGLTLHVDSIGRIDLQRLDHSGRNGLKFRPKRLQGGDRLVRVGEDIESGPTLSVLIELQAETLAFAWRD